MLLENGIGGYQPQLGVKTMTIASITRGTAPTISRQQAIENALYLALWHIRQDCAPSHIYAAAVKAVWAAAVLKQPCTESTLLPTDLLSAIQGRAAS
jgi:hypothetical protein